VATQRTRASTQRGGYNSNPAMGFAAKNPFFQFCYEIFRRYISTSLLF